MGACGSTARRAPHGIRYERRAQIKRESNENMQSRGAHNAATQGALGSLRFIGQNSRSNGGRRNVMALGKGFGERGIGVQEGHGEFAWMGARAPAGETIAANLGSGEPIVPRKGEGHYVSCPPLLHPGREFGA
jgi:hypothetical protein